MAPVFPHLDLFFSTLRAQTHGLWQMSACAHTFLTLTANTVHQRLTRNKIDKSAQVFNLLVQLNYSKTLDSSTKSVLERVPIPNTFSACSLHGEWECGQSVTRC